MLTTANMSINTIRIIEPRKIVPKFCSGMGFVLKSCVRLWCCG